jgi:hypothetical protein
MTTRFLNRFEAALDRSSVYAAVIVTLIVAGSSFGF